MRFVLTQTTCLAPQYLSNGIRRIKKWIYIYTHTHIQKLALFVACLLMCFKHLFPFDPACWSVHGSDHLSNISGAVWNAFWVCKNGCLFACLWQHQLCLFYNSRFSFNTIWCRMHVVGWFGIWVRSTFFLWATITCACVNLELPTRISNDLGFVGFRLHSLLWIERALVKQSPLKLRTNSLQLHPTTVVQGLLCK